MWFNRERPIEVEVSAVTERAAGTQASVLNASGYVTARRRATVSSKVTGKLIEVNVEEGMAVREGQVLARLDDSHRARLAGAGAGAARSVAAHRSGDRSAARRSADHAPPPGAAVQGGPAPRRPKWIRRRRRSIRCIARLESTREQINVAESQVALQQTALDDTVIRAPFSGVAISKDAQPGEMVSPVSAGGGFTRTGICTIVDMKSLEIEVDVNESYISRVTAGQPVTRGARCVSGLADSGEGDHDGARRPIGRRRRCWCASASTRSIRAFCPTWGSR